jgi:hypothetical protein
VFDIVRMGSLLYPIQLRLQFERSLVTTANGIGASKKAELMSSVTGIQTIYCAPTPDGLWLLLSTEFRGDRYDRVEGGRKSAVVYIEDESSLINQILLKASERMGWRNPLQRAVTTRPTR